MRARFYGWITLLITTCILLLGCQAAAPAQVNTLGPAASPGPAASTPTPTIEPSPTLPPTATLAPTNTPLPTTPPTPTITPFPWSNQVISPENAQSLDLRGSWGRGQVENYAASVTGYAAAQTHAGVYLYKIGEADPIAYYDGASGFVPSPGWDLLILYYPDSTLKLVNTTDGSVLYTYASIVTIPRFFPENYTPEIIAEVTRMRHEFIDAAFSPDGKWLAAAFGEGRIGVWSTQDGSLRQNLFKEMTGVSNNIAFSPDGSRLACSGNKGWTGGGMISMWDLDAGELLWYVPKAGRLTVNPFSPDGSLIATRFSLSAGSTENIVLRRTKDGTELGSTSGYVSDSPFSPDGTLLVVSNRTDVKILQLVPNFTILRTLHTQINDSSARFDPDSAEPLVVLNDQEVWSVAEHNLIGPYQGEIPAAPPLISDEDWAAMGHLADTAGMVIAGSGEWFMWGGSGPFWRWQPLTHQVDWVTFTGKALSTPALSPSGTLLAACIQKNQQEKYLTIYSFADNTQKTAGRCDYPASLAILPDEKTLIHTISTRVEMVDLATGEALHRFTGHTLKPDYLAVSADGRWLASEGYDRGGGIASETRLWSLDLARGARLEENYFHEWGGGLVFSAGSDVLISNSGRLWQTETGVIRYLRWEEDPAASAVSPDGAFLAAALRDGTIQFYSLPDGDLIWESPRGSLAQPVGLVFTPDGKNLILASSDGVVRLLGIP